MNTDLTNEQTIFDNTMSELAAFMKMLDELIKINDDTTTKQLLLDLHTNVFRTYQNMPWPDK